MPIESDVNTDEFGYGHTEYTRLEKWSGKKAYEGDEPENVRNYLSTELIQELGGYLEEYTVEQQERIKALEKVVESQTAALAEALEGVNNQLEEAKSDLAFVESRMG